MIELPPIKVTSRGFVRKDGSVVGWSLLDGGHNEYHMMHGTNDRDFQARWRQWSEGERIDFDEYSQYQAEWETAVEEWISENADEIIPMPR